MNLNRLIRGLETYGFKSRGSRCDFIFGVGLQDFRV